MKCHEHLHLSIEFENSYVNHNTFLYQSCSLDTFKQIASTSEQAK